MKHLEDSLESELSSWQPVPVSADLKQRIGRDISPMALRKRTYAQTFFLAGTLAAACLLLTLLSYFRQEINHAQRDTGSVPAASTPSLPTLGVYDRALSQSLDALDSLLQLHASANTNRTVTIHAFQLSSEHFE